MRTGKSTAAPGLVAVLLCLLSLSPMISADSSQLIPGQQSWAVGVVVPDGADLEGGARVAWSQVENVSVVVKVPNMTLADGTTYAILSLMTEDGVVLQTAIGVNPGEDAWLVDSMYIEDINHTPQVYHWALNSSSPASGPGQEVCISVHRTEAAGWAFRVTNLQTNGSVTAPFGVAASPRLMSGSQEVFALESYSTSPSTFQHMGNLTLEAVYLDGLRAAGGWYGYGDWDPSHSLPFVVGGANPPSWVGLWVTSAGTAGWYFLGDPGAVWGGLHNGTGPAAGMSLAAVVAASVVLSALLARRKGSAGQPGEESGGGSAE
jgi:hypothetical protein